MVTYSVTIEDKQGNYDANGVKIKLTTAIPEYISVDYYAPFDQDVNCYKLNVDVSWPDDKNPYTV